MTLRRALPSCVASACLNNSRRYSGEKITIFSNKFKSSVFKYFAITDRNAFPSLVSSASLNNLGRISGVKITICCIAFNFFIDFLVSTFAIAAFVVFPSGVSANANNSKRDSPAEVIIKFRPLFSNNLKGESFIS